MIKEVIFDFDGTVADSFGVIMDLFAKNKDSFGFENFGKEQIRIYKEEGVAVLLKKEKISPFRVVKIIRVGKKQMMGRIGEVKVFEGIKKLLMDLKKKGLVLGIMSTNGEENINVFLKQNEIEKFDYVVGKGSLFGKDKIIKSILRKRKLKSEEVLYVGDEVRDIEACRKLGIKMVAVTWGFNSKRLLEKSKPDFLVDRPEEILKLV